MRRTFRLLVEFDGRPRTMLVNAPSVEAAILYVQNRWQCSARHYPGKTSCDNWLADFTV